MRIIVGVTGASGVEMSCALVETLKSFPDCAVHLVVSDAARRNWELETAMPFEQFVSMADVVHDVHNMAASISSGSFVTDGMIIAPCSMMSLAGIVSGSCSSRARRRWGECIS